MGGSDPAEPLTTAHSRPRCLRVGCPEPSEAARRWWPPALPCLLPERGKEKASWEGRRWSRGSAAFPAWLRTALGWRRGNSLPGGLRPPRLGEGFPRRSRGCLLMARGGAGWPGWGKAGEPLTSAQGPGAPSARPTARGERAAEKTPGKGLTLKKKKGKKILAPFPIAGNISEGLTSPCVWPGSRCTPLCLGSGAGQGLSPAAVVGSQEKGVRHPLCSPFLSQGPRTGPGVAEGCATPKTSAGLGPHSDFGGGCLSAGGRDGNEWGGTRHPQMEGCCTP